MAQSSLTGGELDAKRLISFADKGTGSADGARSEVMTHFEFVLVSGGMSGETVISGEGGLLDAASFP